MIEQTLEELATEIRKMVATEEKRRVKLVGYFTLMWGVNLAMLVLVIYMAWLLSSL